MSFLSGCDDNKASTSKVRKSKPQLVKTLVIKQEDSSIERRFNATISAPNTIRISNQIAGALLEIPHREGDRVKKGDILIHLDDSLIRAEYEKAIASYEQAKQNYERTLKLVPSKLASEEELSTARTDLKLSEADLKLKKIQLERSTIKAPFNGVISERLFEPGDTVSVNTHILTLVDTSHFVIRSSIPESYLSYVNRGMIVNISVPALDYDFDAKISTIFPTVDSSTQQIDIKASIEHTDKQLYPGLFAEMIINKKIDNAILIPVNAVQYDSNGTWVYCVDSDNKIKITAVRTGSNINDKIVIKRGLKPGDIIITKGFVGLRPGKIISTTSTPDQSKNIK